MNMIPDWAKETFASHRDLISKSLISCHNERSRAIIADLLEGMPHYIR